MRISIGDDQNQRSVIELGDTELDSDALFRAIQDPMDDRIHCATPGALHARIGHVSPTVDVAIRPCLAGAMRSRRTSTPVDRALATAESERNSLEIPEVDLESERETVAATRQDEQALRERVARLGGRVTALREAPGGDPSEAAKALQSAAKALSEAETEHLAARQRLEEKRVAARHARDVENRRLRLTDRIANLEQEARETLVEAGWASFTDAVRALPTDTDVGADPSSWDGPGWVAAIALLQIADVEAPVIVEGVEPQALGTPERLETTVIRV